MKIESETALLRQQIQKLKSRCDGTYQDKLDGKITEEDWTRRTRSWQEEIIRMEANVSRLELATPASYMMTAKRVLELAKRLPDVLFSLDAEKKRELVHLVCQNLKLDVETLHVDYAIPFSLMLEKPSKTNWGPPRDTSGKKLILRTSFSPSYLSALDTTKATLGARLRYLRKRLGYTITTYATVTRLSHNTIARLERDENKKIQPWILGRILPLLAEKFNEAFPGAQGDAYDYLIPPKTFGDWLRNFRLRRGLHSKDLASVLGVNKFTITRYETNQSYPNAKICDRLRARFGLNGAFFRKYEQMPTPFSTKRNEAQGLLTHTK